MTIVRHDRAIVNVGDKFGRLKIIGQPFYVRVGSQRKRMQHAVCECECGKTIAARCSILKIGRLLSCGCYHSDELKARNTTHGLAPRTDGPKPYDTWCHIRERCLDPRGKYFHRYGGRGIRVCDEWVDDPVAFCEWALANGWKPKLQIDRIDNNGNYEPDNCRFVTHAENQRNRERRIPAS
jgi:hypothetical protein